jgi:signal transduction histidine kinase
LFVVYCNSPTETVSTASKLKLAVLAIIFFFVSPVCVVVLLDRQREYEEQEIRMIETIDVLLGSSSHDSIDSSALQFQFQSQLQRRCRATNAKALITQTAAIRQARIERYFTPGHPPNSPPRLVYVAEPRAAERYTGSINGFMMEKSVETNRSINGAEYVAAFVKTDVNAAARFDGRTYTWSRNVENGPAHATTRSVMLYTIVMPYEPLAIYVGRPAFIMLAMLLAAAILAPMSIEVLLRLTFVKPFQQLLAGVDEANQGNLNARVPVQFHDEIGGLTAHFNQMIVSIQTAQARYYHALEQQVRERERISQDVHDDVGSTLTRVALLAEALKFNSLERQTEHQTERQTEHQMQSHLTAIATLAREATSTLSEIIWAIIPVNDTLDNFLAYTREYAMDLFDETDIWCSVEKPVTVPPLSLLPEVRRNAFLLVKESLNNALKHSGASQVSVGFVCDKTLLEICVRDNGCGFDAQTTQEPARSSGGNGNGNGLGNMRRRMERIGGILRIESLPGDGTRITAQIPLHDAA